MSSLAPRNSYPLADEQQWQESSDIVDLSPASVWAPDVEEEDETTLQGKRVDPQYREQDLVDTPREVPVLDESQVLPGEASYATVSLNQPFEESVLKPPDSWEPISTGSIDDYREHTPASRVPILDESQILDGEASFATVMLGGHAKAQRHSAITEFLVKTKLSLKQLVLAIFALVSVLALAVIVFLSTTSSGVVTVSSAPPPAPADTASQPASASITESREPALILNSRGGVSGSAEPAQPKTAAETQRIAEAKIKNSDDSRKAPSSDAKSGAARQETLREVSSVGVRVSLPKERVIETKKQSAPVSKKAVKEPAVVKTSSASVKSQPRAKSSEPASRQSEAPVKVEKVETKTPPITGGGERPRTVTRKSSP